MFQRIVTSNATVSDLAFAKKVPLNSG